GFPRTALLEYRGGAEPGGGDRDDCRGVCRSRAAVMHANPHPLAYARTLSREGEGLLLPSPSREREGPGAVRRREGEGGRRLPGSSGDARTLTRSLALAPSPERERVLRGWLMSADRFLGFAVTPLTRRRIEAFKANRR